ETVSEIAHSIFLSRPRAASTRSTESGKHSTRTSRQTYRHCPPSKPESPSLHHAYSASYPSSSAYQSKANARVPCREFDARSRRMTAAPAHGTCAFNLLASSQSHVQPVPGERRREGFSKLLFAWKRSYS